jgi:hypothetical protein
LLAAHDGPWPRVPASARPRTCDDAAVAQSLPATSRRCYRSTARHLRSTRSPCSHRLHMCATSLSPHSCHAEAPFPSSPSTVAKVSPHSALLTVCLCHCCAHCQPRQPPMLPSSVSTGALPSCHVTICKRSRQPARPCHQSHRPLHPPRGAHHG